LQQQTQENFVFEIRYLQLKQYIAAILFYY